MRVLAVTNMYPAPAHPTHGVFVEQQVLGLQRIGVDVEVLYVDRVERGMRAYFDMQPRFEAALGRAPVDVVHLMYGGIMAERALSRAWSQPTVVTFHGSDLLGEHLSGLRRRVIAQIGVAASNRAARRASAVVVVSQRLARALPSSVPADRVHVVPCGIDLDRFVPLDRTECQRTLGWDPTAFHLLFPANTGDPVKRPDLAAAAVRCLTATGVRAELHHLQGIPNEQVPIWINASHALLLTSRHEGSPTVVKEALACNVPVVSVDVGDVVERIDGIDGCHLAAPEARDLADKLALVHASGRRVRGRERMASLSHVAIAERLRALYEQLLHAAPVARRAGAVSA